jgi:hypothetical protein
MSQLSLTKTAGRLIGDKRTTWAKRFVTLFDQHVADLGGIEPSAAQASLCRRAATLEIGLEHLEQRMAGGDDDPALLDQYARAAGTLKRVLEALGIERRAKDVTPSLDTYLAAKAQQKTTSEES